MCVGGSKKLLTSVAYGVGIFRAAHHRNVVAAVAYASGLKFRQHKAHLQVGESRAFVGKFVDVLCRHFLAAVPVHSQTRVCRRLELSAVGGDLEYIDEVTLLRALEGRTEL